MCILKRPSFTAAGVNTNLLACDPYGALTNELAFAFGLPSAALARPLDALGRPAGYALAAADRLPAGVAYGYNDVGQFVTLSSSNILDRQALNVNYTRQDGRLAGRALQRGNGPVATAAWSYDLRRLITALSNTVSTTAACLSACHYANDALGRRVSRADSGLAFANPAFDAYSYNIRSEVTGATRRWGTPDAPGALVPGRQYAYAFDSIGNRITAAEGDTARTASYTANALNQYTQRTVPDEKDLIGTAPTNVAVTVNQNPVSRQSAYWHHALEVDNATEAACPDVAITAVYNPPGTNDPDVVTSTTGRVFVARTPEQFLYDDDGNLTQDGRFTYTWDAENRLIKAETRDDLPAAVPRVMVEYAYDHQSRRIASSSAVWINGSWQAVESRVFLYDGWNVVSELTYTQTHTLTNSYLWGLDLSGSLQGAGGVGGLLAEIKDGTPYFAAFDANGNVTEYLSEDGTLAAHYEYSPFGEIVVQSGPLGDSFTHRFSTKPWCAVTGLSEYEYRKYSPTMGRWLSRDPINDVGFRKLLPRSLGIGPLDGPSFRMPVFQGEQAHILLSELLKKLPEPKRIYIDEERQLYGFVFNDPVNATDLLGLKLCVCCFKFNVGKLYIDASCKGVLSIWVIDEGSAPAAGGTAGSWVSADGYVLGGTTYKIDGSTCVKMTCTASSVSVETCVNLAAGIGGKKPPYAVPGGTFGGSPKEPAAGSTPPVVK